MKTFLSKCDLEGNFAKIVYDENRNQIYRNDNLFLVKRLTEDKYMMCNRKGDEAYLLSFDSGGEKISKIENECFSFNGGFVFSDTSKKTLKFFDLNMNKIFQYDYSFMYSISEKDGYIELVLFSDILVFDWFGNLISKRERRNYRGRFLVDFTEKIDFSVINGKKKLFISPIEYYRRGIKIEYGDEVFSCIFDIDFDIHIIQCSHIINDVFRIRISNGYNEVLNIIIDLRYNNILFEFLDEPFNKIQKYSNRTIIMTSDKTIILNSNGSVEAIQERRTYLSNEIYKKNNLIFNDKKGIAIFNQLDRYFADMRDQNIFLYNSQEGKGFYISKDGDVNYYGF